MRLGPAGTLSEKRPRRSVTAVPAAEGGGAPPLRTVDVATTVWPARDWPGGERQAALKASRCGRMGSARAPIAPSGTGARPSRSWPSSRTGLPWATLPALSRDGHTHVEFRGAPAGEPSRAGGRSSKRGVQRAVRLGRPTPDLERRGRHARSRVAGAPARCCGPRARRMRTLWALVPSTCLIVRATAVSLPEASSVDDAGRRAARVAFPAGDSQCRRAARGGMGRWQVVVA